MTYHPLSWNTETGEFRLEQDERIDRYVVPKGFEHDFASIPRVLRVWLDPYSPKIGPASVVHDYLYVWGKQGRSVAMHPGKESCGFVHHDGVTPSRRFADREFRRILRSYGVNRVQAGVMYLAVRAFGWLYWRRR